MSPLCAHWGGSCHLQEAPWFLLFRNEKCCRCSIHRWMSHYTSMKHFDSQWIKMPLITRAHRGDMTYSSADGAAGARFQKKIRVTSVSSDESIWFRRLKHVTGTPPLLQKKEKQTKTLWQVEARYCALKRNERQETPCEYITCIHDSWSVWERTCICVLSCHPYVWVVDYDYT